MVTRLYFEHEDRPLFEVGDEGSDEIPVFIGQVLDVPQLKRISPPKQVRVTNIVSDGAIGIVDLVQ